METDKVSVEVPALEAGILTEIVASNGVTVAVGSLLGTIDNSNLTSRSEKYPPMPSAQKLINENSIDATLVIGTGKNQRIIKENVLTVLHNNINNKETSLSQDIKEAKSREERVRMTRLRKTISERLKMAQNTAAILTTFNEVDMTNIMSLRNKYKDIFKEKYGIRLGFMSFFVKAAVYSLKEWPSVNSEIDNDYFIYKNHYDIGVAVGTENGLVVPVVRDADILSFSEIEQCISNFGKKAHEGKLTIDDMTGGTFTISNGGVYGSLMSTPILNPPQSAILGMHKTISRPIVTSDGKIEARPIDVPSFII